MTQNVTRKLIESHRVDGEMVPGADIGLKIDQTLTQDATGTMVMLEFEAMNIPRVRTELSAQYVDHNLLQLDYKNADDHLFLRSACRKFGLWYSRPGNGVSHPVHMEHFGVPGKTLPGSDSHTPSAVRAHSRYHRRAGPAQDGRRYLHRRERYPGPSIRSGPHHEFPAGRYDPGGEPDRCNQKKEGTFLKALLFKQVRETFDGIL